MTFSNFLLKKEYTTFFAPAALGSFVPFLARAMALLTVLLVAGCTSPTEGGEVGEAPPSGEGTTGIAENSTQPNWLNGTDDLVFTQLVTGAGVGHTQRPGCRGADETEMQRVLAGTVRAEWSSGAAELTLVSRTLTSNGVRITGESPLEIELEEVETVRSYLWGLRPADVAGNGATLEQPVTLSWNIQYTGTENVEVFQTNC